LKEEDFAADDRRDQNEEVVYGQQVALCIDKADILIDNSTIQLAEFRQKVLSFSDLAIGRLSRAAAGSEILMNMEYSAAHTSKCLKRHVGAVVVDTKGRVVGVGFNENPLNTKPCCEEPAYSKRCYRDVVRNEHLKDLNSQGVLCPRCGRSFGEQNGPPWICVSCGADDIEDLFFTDRALSWCTAIHAELWALLAAGDRAYGGILYTTTFPCFQCAEKIKQCGIETVYYTEAYPDPFSKDRLILSNVNLKQFEGVRSSSFERIFSVQKPK
jgi:deoxycytidylate deaminase